MVIRIWTIDTRYLDYLQAASIDAGGLYSIVKKFEILQNNNSPQIALLSATHPAAKLRLEKIRKLLPKNQPAVAVPIDSTEYHKMKELLARMPR